MRKDYIKQIEEDKKISDAQDKRYEALLTKWEEQAKRQDEILKRQEKLLDAQEKKKE